MLTKSWFDAHKVFFLGLLASIAVALEPLVTNASQEVTYKMLGFALASAILSYFAKEWRGQGLSLIGIIGNLAGVMGTVLMEGNIRVPQLIIQFILAVAMAAGADPKSRGYEASNIIQQAKVEGEIINPAPLTNQAIKEQAKAITGETKANEG